MSPRRCDWPGATALTNDAVAEGAGISSGYLSELRRGVKTNVTVGHLEKLAAWFEVDPCYFICDDERADAILAEYRRRPTITPVGAGNVPLMGRPRGSSAAVVPESAANEIADLVRAEMIRLLRGVEPGEEQPGVGDGDSQQEGPPSR